MGRRECVAQFGRSTRELSKFAFLPLLLVCRRAFRFIGFPILEQMIDNPRDFVRGKSLARAVFSRALDVEKRVENSASK